MPHYIHTVFCKRCGHQFKIPRDDDQYFNPGLRCYELVSEQKDMGVRGCSGFVRWKGWEVGTRPQPILTTAASLEGRGISYLTQLRHNNWAAAKSMIAIMWDPTRAEWVRGQCGTSHHTDRGNIPLAVWNQISDEWDVDDMRFGRNCAEVNALRTLYNNHPPAAVADLSNYRFIAMDRNCSVRGPCGGCRLWLRHFRIQAYSNGAWQVP
jgi:hypothetical protein